MASGSLQVCPGTTVGLRCSHDGVVDLSRWRVTPPLPMDCNTAITHTASPNSEAVCGPFTVSMISANSERLRMSTLELIVTESLNGVVVTCYAGGAISDPVVGNFTIQIIGEIACIAMKLLAPLKLAPVYMHGEHGQSVKVHVLFSIQPGSITPLTPCSLFYCQIFACILFKVFISTYTGPPSLPTISSMEYSVIDSTTGQITLLVISAGTFGTNVSFYGSVEGIGTVVVTDNNVTVTGLSYTESHTVNVVATSDVCHGVLNSSVTVVPVMFNIRSE